MQRRGSRRGLVATAALLAAGAPAPAFDPRTPEAWLVPDPDLYAVAVRGERVWAVGYWGTALRSGDGGQHFEVVRTPTRATLFDVSFADADHGFAVGENGTVLRTRDGGATWEHQPVEVQDELGGPRPLDLHLFGVCALSPSEAWAVGDLGAVLRTRDGVSWQAVAIPPEAYGDEELAERILNAVHFSDPLHGYIVGEFGTTLRTADGGQSWTGQRQFEGVAPDLYLFDVAAFDARNAATVGLAGSVLVTEDGGASWAARRVGASVPLYGIFWDRGTGVAVGNRGELFATRDRGRSWQRPERPLLFNWLRDVAAASEERLFAVGEKGLVLRSDDGGASWRQLFGREPPPLSGVSVPGPGRSSELGPEGPRVRLVPGEPRD